MVEILLWLLIVMAGKRFKAQPVKANAKSLASGYVNCDTRKLRETLDKVLLLSNYSNIIMAMVKNHG